MPVKNKIKFNILFISFISGSSGLSFEIIWTKMLGLGLGHEALSLLAVISAFFTGLSLGSKTADFFQHRSISTKWLYSISEIIIGAWALLLTGIIPRIHHITGFFPESGIGFFFHGLIAFASAFLILLPATFAMGCTLPFLSRTWQSVVSNGNGFSGLYGANTLGAVTGSLCITFIIIPSLGFTASSIIMACLNFSCAFLIQLIHKEPRTSITESIKNLKLRKPKLNQISLYILLFSLGFLAMSWELVIIRILSSLYENTVFSFANILAVYLMGSALGALIYFSRIKNQDYRIFLKKGFLFLLLTICASLLLFYPSRLVYLSITQPSTGIGAAFAGEMISSIIIFLAPAMLSGMVYCHLIQGLDQNNNIGTAIALNTLGGAVAPFLIGFLLIPLLGTKMVLILIVVFFACIFIFLESIIPSKKSLIQSLNIPLLICLLCFIVFLFLPFRSLFTTIEKDEKLLLQMEGTMGTVSVVETKSGEKTLKVNNHFQMGGTSSMFSDQRQGHIPLLLHPHPKKALFLGLGTGATFFSALFHPYLEADGVELLPEIISVIPQFTQAFGEDWKNKRLRIINADARRFVIHSQEKYDVIISDLFHPSRDGAGFLYTVEHFSAVKKILNQKGLFCQWLPLYQLDLKVLKSIVTSFLKVYPQALAIMTHFNVETPIIGLIGGHDRLNFDMKIFNDKMNNPLFQQILQPLRINNSFELTGLFMGNAKSLKNFAGKAEINTDDHPVVVYKSPQFLYHKNQSAVSRLIALINTLKISAADVYSPLELNQNQKKRFNDYIEARNAFIQLGAGISPTQDPESLLSQIKTPMLNIIAKSQDFTSAYNPLLELASRIAKEDSEKALSLLYQLNNTRPERSEAKKLIQFIKNQIKG